MRTPSASDLLDAWDRGATLPSVERLSPLLVEATGRRTTELSELRLGERNRLLVELRQRLFGASMRMVVDCPSCGLALELVLATGTLLAADNPSADGPSAGGMSRGHQPSVVDAGVIIVEVDGYQARCRPLRTADLVGAASAGSLAAARQMLIERAVLTAVHEDAPVAVGGLPSAVVDAIAKALARSDPLADVEVPIDCEACGTSWTRPFDIADYLWRELDGWAVALLTDVHVLASAYGWTEPTVLALSPTRRRHYLELIADG